MESIEEVSINNLNLMIDISSKELEVLKNKNIDYNKELILINECIDKHTSYINSIHNKNSAQALQEISKKCSDHKFMIKKLYSDIEGLNIIIARRTNLVAEAVVNENLKYKELRELKSKLHKIKSEINKHKKTIKQKDPKILENHFEVIMKGVKSDNELLKIAENQKIKAQEKLDEKYKYLQKLQKKNNNKQMEFEELCIKNNKITRLGKDTLREKNEFKMHTELVLDFHEKEKVSTISDIKDKVEHPYINEKLSKLNSKIVILDQKTSEFQLKKQKYTFSLPDVNDRYSYYVLILSVLSTVVISKILLRFFFN